MKLQTEIRFKKQSDNLINYASNILLIGSCFVENIGNKLEYFKFQNLLNPFGILFHPKAIEILIAGAKLGWVNMGLSPVDLQLLESEKITLRELCNVYGVNSALFNDPDNKTYNNMKEAKKEMLTQVVLPELVLIRDAFNRFFENCRRNNFIYYFN